MSAAIDEYLAERAAGEARASSLASTGHRLRGLLQVDAAAGRPGGPIAELTPARARRLLADFRHRRHRADGGAPLALSVTYRRGALAEACTWATWCAGRGYLRGNPFGGLKVTGTGKRGKDQLRIEEAQRYASTALELAAAGDVGALAAWLVLLLGGRASEVATRDVRDVDAGGSILWIDRAKTARGIRRLEIPEVARPLLIATTKDRQGLRRPDRSPLFQRGEGADARRGDRQWLYYQVGRICRLAGVPRVCPQALRGLHSTLATEAGVSSHAVAGALGHDLATNQRHYTAPDATAAARQQRSLRVLEGGRR